MTINKSKDLRALEWIDQTTRDGDALFLAKARLALELHILSKRNTRNPQEAYQIRAESFLRKYSREPLEDIVAED
jgi:hypothetical protein